MGTGWWELRILASEIECSLARERSFDQFFVRTGYTGDDFPWFLENDFCKHDSDDGTSFNAAVTRRRLMKSSVIPAVFAAGNLMDVFKGHRVDRCFFCTL